MPSPQWNGNPARYRPNQIDDRAVTGPLSDVYLRLATAIEAIEHGEDGIPGETFLALDPGTRKAIRSAENALRRAAFSVVLHAPEG
jgi:hypothetical protein